MEEKVEEVEVGICLAPPSWNGVGIEKSPFCDAPLVQLNQLHLGGPALKLVEFFPLVAALGCKASLNSVRDSLKANFLRNKTCHLMQKVFLHDVEVSLLMREYQSTPSLTNKDWAARDETQYGPDLLTVEACLRLFQEKVKAAFKHDKSLVAEGKPKIGESTATLLGGMLISSLVSQEAPAYIFPEVKIGEPATKSQMEKLKRMRPPPFFIHDLMGQSGLDIGFALHAMTPAGFMLMSQYLEHSFSLLLSQVDAKNVKKGWSFEMRAPAENKSSSPKGGRPRKPFKSFLEQLVRKVTLPEHNLGEGRKCIAWGHWSTLAMLKCKSLHPDRVNAPIGMAFDGVDSGGRKLHGARLRDDWFSKGHYSTVTVPHIEHGKYGDAEAQKFINACEELKKDPELQAKQKGGLDNARLMRRLSYICTLQDLGVTRPVALTIDKGPSEKAYPMFRQLRGDPIHVTFDSCHDDANACTHQARADLPELYFRFHAIRSCHNGSHSVKFGHFFKTFLEELSDEQQMKIVSDLREQLSVDVDEDHDSPQLLRKVRERMRYVHSHLASFPKQGRFNAEAYSVFFTKMGWSLLRLAMRAYIFKEDPNWLKPQVRTVIEKIEEDGGATLFRMVYNPEDLKDDPAAKACEKLLFTDMAMKADGADPADEEEVDRRFTVERALGFDEDPNEEPKQELAAESRFLLSDTHAQHDKKVAEAKKLKETAQEKKELTDGQKVLVKKVEFNLIKCLYLLLVDDEVKAKVLIFERLTRAQLWFHAMSIAMTEKNFFSRSIFYNHPATCIAATVRNYQEPLDQNMGELFEVDPNRFAGAMGRSLERVLDEQMKIQQQRLNKNSRILMYGIRDDSDLSYQEFVQMCENEEKTKKHALSWLLLGQDGSG
eukprot:g18687.t1